MNEIIDAKCQYLQKCMPLEVLDALVKNVNQMLHYTSGGAVVVDRPSSNKVASFLIERFIGCGLHAHQTLFKQTKHAQFAHVVGQFGMKKRVCVTFSFGFDFCLEGPHTFFIYHVTKVIYFGSPKSCFCPSSPPVHNRLEARKPLSGVAGALNHSCWQ